MTKRFWLGWRLYEPQCRSGYARFLFSRLGYNKWVNNCVKQTWALLLFLTSSVGCHKWHADASAAAYLKTVATAEADFRANDRGEHHSNDYWVKDVAGLYGIDPGNGPIKLVVLDLAQADRSIGKGKYKAVPDERAYIGYYWATLKRYQEKGKSIAYDRGAGRNPEHFGLVAFPAEYGEASRLTFIVSEKNIIYSKDTHGLPPEEFPENPEKDGWKDYDKR